MYLYMSFEDRVIVEGDVTAGFITIVVGTVFLGVSRNGIYMYIQCKGNQSEKILALGILA